jgi:hypothetical protein
VLRLNTLLLLSSHSDTLIFQAGEKAHLVHFIFASVTNKLSFHRSLDSPFPVSILSLSSYNQIS